MSTETPRVACLTPIAIDALRNARDHGTVWYSIRYTPSTARLADNLRKMGLLSGVQITAEGEAALARLEASHG